MYTISKIHNLEGLSVEMRELEIAAALVDRKNMSEAALFLRVSQSAVSHALSRMEQLLGGPLFYRQHGFRPTPLGEIYLKYAREMLEIRARTYRSMEMVRGRHIQTFSLGLSPHLDMEILIGLYDEYQQKWPGVRIDAVECYSREAIDRVVAGQMDIAVGIQDNDLIRGGKLRFLPIQRIEYLLVVAEHNALAEGGVSSFQDAAEIPFRSLSDFREVPYIAYDRRALSSAALTQSLFREAGFSPLTINRTGSIAFSKSLAVQNNAFTFIPLDSMNGSFGLRCFRLSPNVTILKGYYVKPGFVITPPVAEFLTMFAAQMKLRYPFSSALYLTPFSVPAKYISGEQADKEDMYV